MRAQAGKKKELMMWEALREATDEEMERDPTVCVMGEQRGRRWGGAGGRSHSAPREGDACAAASGLATPSLSSSPFTTHNEALPTTNEAM